MKKILNYLNKTNEYYEKHKIILNMIVIVSTFLMFFYIYEVKPLRSDDYTYMVNLATGKPIQSVWDCFVSGYHHYMTWGGRSVGVLSTQILLLVGKPIMSIVNTITLMLTVYLIMKIIGKKSIFVYFTILGCIWYINPNTNDTLLWQSGNGSFMYPFVFVLLYSYPFAYWLENKELPKYYFFYLLASFFAGWSNENLGPTLFLFVSWVIFLIYRKTKKLNILLVISALIELAGAFICVFAPGNFVRAGVAKQPLLLDIFYRLHAQASAWLIYLFFAFMLLIISYYVLYKNNLKVNDKVKYMSIWAVLSLLILLGSPILNSRSTYGTFNIICICFISNFVLYFENTDKENKTMIKTLLFCLWLSVMYSVLVTARISYITGV